MDGRVFTSPSPAEAQASFAKLEALSHQTEKFHGPPMWYYRRLMPYWWRYYYSPHAFGYHPYSTYPYKKWW